MLGPSRLCLHTFHTCGPTPEGKGPLSLFVPESSPRKPSCERVTVQAVGKEQVEEELGAQGPGVHGSRQWATSQEQEVAGRGCRGLEEVFISLVT